MAGEVEPAGFAIDQENSDIVTTLIAAIKELAGGVEIEAARIIATCPFFSDVYQCAISANGKDPNAVVQSVARIDKPAIG